MAGIAPASLIGGHPDQFIIVIRKDGGSGEDIVLNRWQNGRVDTPVVFSNKHTAEAVAWAITDGEERGRNEIRRKLRELTFVSDED